MNSPVASSSSSQSIVAADASKCIGFHLPGWSRPPILAVLGALIALSMPTAAASQAAAELTVDAKAAAGGKGSTDAPFQTLSEAVKAAVEGGTVTVREGIYRETVVIPNRKSGAPLIIRAAPGARVVVTAFDVLRGWKDEGKGLYSLTTPQRVNDLYVAGVHQRLARFPDAQSPYLKVAQADAAAGTVQVDSFPILAAGEEKSLCLFVLCTNGNVDSLYRIKSIDAKNKTVSVQATKWTFPKTGDYGLLFNAPSLIKYPGEWACEQMDDHSWKTVFRPQSAADLDKTETRSSVRRDVFEISGCSQVTLEGLEISGGGRHGITADHDDQLRVERCLIYDNGVGGISATSCTNLMIDSCIIFANHHGVVISQGHDITVQGCEVAWNEEDGIDFCGVGLQDAKAPPLGRVTLRRNYIHGHSFLGHPDNTQSWGNVQGVLYEDNLLMLGGTSGTLEDIGDMKLLHNVSLGSGTHQFGLGGARGMHIADHDIDFENDIIGYGGLGAVAMANTVHDVKFFHDVFFHNLLMYDGSHHSSGDNLFWDGAAPDAGVIVSTMNKWTKYTSPTELNAANKDLEAGSQKADPQFKNMPVCLLDARGFGTGPSQVAIPKDPSATFAVGDFIEVNGDGVVRKINAVDGQVITFSPPLLSAPFRDVLIWNWGANSNFQFDLKSPVVGGAGQPGTYLDVPAYQRGELDGSGKRSLPALTTETRAIMPDPSNFVFPYFLYLENRFD